MTAHVLIAGTLFRAPDQRTSKAGKPFVTATLKVKDGENSQFWRLAVFSGSIQAELMRLTDGDAISAQGAFKAELYDTAAKSGSRYLSSRIMSWRSALLCSDRRRRHRRRYFRNCPGHR